MSFGVFCLLSQLLLAVEVGGLTESFPLIFTKKYFLTTHIHQLTNFKKKKYDMLMNIFNSKLFVNIRNQIEI